MTGRTIVERIESLESNVAAHEKQIHGVLQEHLMRMEDRVQRLEAELGVNRVSPVDEPLSRAEVLSRAEYVAEERRWAT